MEEERLETVELETTESEDVSQKAEETPLDPEERARKLFASYLEPSETAPEPEPKEDMAEELEATPEEQAEPIDLGALLEEIEEDVAEEKAVDEEERQEGRNWYVVHSYSGYENKVKKNLEHRIESLGMQDKIFEVVVPTEDVAEFNKSGKRRVVKKKLYPGYIMINMVLNDDTWFLVRETPGIGDFTGSAGKPTPMEPHEVQRIIATSTGDDTGEAPVRTSIPFKPGDRVRVKEGYFENFEGDVEAIDEANGRVTVMINIFGRSTPVELEHWQVESV